MIFLGVILILLMFLSFLFFIASAIGLFVYVVNSIFNKLKLSKFKFNRSLFKKLLLSAVIFFVLFIGAGVIADEFSYLETDSTPAASTIDEEDNDGIEDTAENETKDKESNKGVVNDSAAKSDKKTSEKTNKVQEEQTKPNKNISKSKGKNKPKGDLEVHFIDVGQADAALISFDNHHILIDAGDWRGKEVVGYLKQVGVKKVDLIVGSHPHADHIGQIDQVIEQFPVEEVWMTGNEATSQIFLEVMQLIDEKGIGYDEPRSGDTYKIGDLKMDILSPENLTGNLNNDSIVMKLTYGKVSFLFTGDIEKSAENHIVNSGHDISATVLKVSHHGSDTSSTKSFLNKVKPQVAVISVGESSKYGHPDKETLNNLNKMGVELYATKSNGTIIATTNGNKLTITVEREGKVTAGKK